MRMIMLALVLLPAAAVAQEREGAPVVKAASPARQCHNARPQMADRAPATVKARPLTQEPRADQYFGVVRLVEGCDMPMKVREDGGTTRR